MDHLDGWVRQNLGQAGVDYLDGWVHCGALLDGNRPVHEVEVQLLNLQVAQSLLARLRHALWVMVLVVQLHSRDHQPAQRSERYID